MDFTLDYASLAKKLERQELESAIGVASPQVYGQLLAIYILFNDLTSAKFLWKRIPANIKENSAELSLIWQVGKCLWKRNYSDLYAVISSHQNWPNHLKNIMNLILDLTRQRAVNLISKAYSSIRLTEAASLLGLSNEETVKLAQSLNWTYDEATQFLGPTSVDLNDVNNSSKNGLFGVDSGTELLKKLTDYILFLESVK